jgi:hypothetical protein
MLTTPILGAFRRLPTSSFITSATYYDATTVLGHAEGLLDGRYIRNGLGPDTPTLRLDHHDYLSGPLVATQTLRFFFLLRRMCIAQHHVLRSASIVG